MMIITLYNTLLYHFEALGSIIFIQIKTSWCRVFPSPLYVSLYFRFDSRGKHYSRALHRADETLLGQRAHFGSYSDPPSLSVQHIKGEDAGLYICRVDLISGPTQYTKVNLTVVSKSNTYAMDTVGTLVFLSPGM